MFSSWPATALRHIETSSLLIETSKVTEWINRKEERLILVTQCTIVSAYQIPNNTLHSSKMLRRRIGHECGQFGGCVWDIRSVIDHKPDERASLFFVMVNEELPRHHLVLCWLASALGWRWARRTSSIEPGSDTDPAFNISADCKAN